MMRKLTLRGVSILGGLLAIAAASPALAGVSTALSMSPGPLLIRNVATSGTTFFPVVATPGSWTWSEFYCLAVDGLGNVQMSYNQSCPSPSGGSYTPWRRGMVAIPWSSNPGTGIGIYWSSVQPSGTGIAARVVSMNADNTVQSVEPFVYGGGSKSQGTASRGDGALLLEIALRSSSVSLSPILTTVSGDVYAD